MKAELNPAYLGQIERGLKCPTIDTLYKVVCALDISLSEFFAFDVKNSTKDTAERILHAVATIPEEKADQFTKLMEELIQLLHD